MGTACYLVNQSLSSTLDDKNPHEVWIGKKPSLTHLRLFGCDACVHIPKEKKCIFIGHKDGMKGYNLWNPENKKVVYI